MRLPRRQFGVNAYFGRAGNRSQPPTLIEFEPDIVGAIVGQAQLLARGVPNVAGEKIDAILSITSSIALKLSALRYHRKGFSLLQDQRTSEIHADPETIRLIKAGIVVCEKEMVFEFEAFLFQVKSCLDMLVKLFVPMLGSKQTDISTYGDKGKKVVTHLQQLKKNKKLNLPVGRVDWLIELIEQVKDPWLKPLIALRDTVSHYKSFIGVGFSWNTENDTPKIPEAMVNGSPVPLIEVMERET